MEKTNVKKGMAAQMLETMKNNFMPKIDDVAKLTIDGTVVVRTNTANGKEYLGFKNGDLMRYPDAMVLEDVPVFTVCKTKEQLRKGDILKATSSTYSIVDEIRADGTIRSVSFGGNVRKVLPIADFFTKQATVRVVVNPFAMAGGAIDGNIMPMLLLMGKDQEGEGNKHSLVEMMMVSSMIGAQGSNPFNGINPMMLMMLDRDGSDMSDVLMLSMLGQGNMNFFGGFGAPAPQPVAVKEEMPAATEAE